MRENRDRRRIEYLLERKDVNIFVRERDGTIGNSGSETTRSGTTRPGSCASEG